MNTLQKQNKVLQSIKIERQRDKLKKVIPLLDDIRASNEQLVSDDDLSQSLQEQLKGSLKLAETSIHTIIGLLRLINERKKELENE